MTFSVSALFSGAAKNGTSLYLPAPLSLSTSLTSVRSTERGEIERMFGRQRLSLINQVRLKFEKSNVELLVFVRGVCTEWRGSAF